jgi:hypothetical protein
MKKKSKKEKNKTKTGLVDQIERWNEKKRLVMRGLEVGS